MKIVLDANILCRLNEPLHSQYQTAKDAISALESRGDQFIIIPQVLYETWVVTTRPTCVNGLGKSAHDAGTDLAYFKRIFPILHDTPAIFSE